MHIICLIIFSCSKKFVWIVPTLVLIVSMILGPLVISDAYAEEKFPEKYVPDRLLIKFKKDISNSEKEKTLKENGASVLAEIKQIDVKLIKVPEQALEKVQAAFAKNSKVEYVEKDFILEPAAIPNDPYYPNQWHLQSIKANEAWDITKGSSIPIAILDTGIDPNHPDLKNKLTLGYNFYNNNADWSDVCGHGTKVAGTAAAITNNGLGVSGVSWNNPIIPIKITDTNCYGYYSSMINGIVYAADKGARVANISFQIFNGAALSDAGRYMNDRGGWVVAAAGNTGILENYSDNPYIISVGATGSNGAVTSFSSYGPFVDFAAPGSSIYTTNSGGIYGYASGTSFSSPIVAGVVGLVISNNPSMTSQQVYDAIKNSAVDKGTAGRDNYYGWGLVDAYGAVLQNNPPPPIDTTPPTVTITNPQNGAAVTGSFTVTVESSDNVAVSKVELYLDGIFYGQKTTVPYNFALDANTMSEGTHEIKAVSIDSSGNSNFAKITVTVVRNATDTIPPNVSITDPPDSSTINGLTNVSVDATDNVAVSAVQLYVNGVLNSEKTSSPYNFSVDTKNLPPGSNILKAKAFDSSNNSNEDIITVLVQANSVPPSISITSPANGATVSGRVKITAVPSNFATTPSVKFFIDGVLKSTDYSSPYEYPWNTRGQSVGSHTITAQAFDSSGNTAANSISVSVAPKSPVKNNSVPTENAKNSQEADLSSTFTEESSIGIIQTSLVQSSEKEEDLVLFAEAPMFVPIGPQTVAEGGSLSIGIVASDPDLDSLTYTYQGQFLPPFAQLTDNDDGTATLIISPWAGDTGEYTITITAIDDSSSPLSNSIIIMLTVTDTNQTPVLSIIESASVNEGLEISAPFFATDPDEDVLSFSAQGLPEFVSLVDNGDRTGSLEIFPDFGDVGEYPISIMVSDISEPELSDSKDFMLTVLESTPSSVILHLQNQKSSLISEDFTNLDQKVSDAAQLHEYLVGATKQERSDFQDSFHDYINAAKNILQTGQGVEQKMILQDISKTQLKLDNVLEKLNVQEENENKAKEAKMLREKRQELADTINQLVAVEHFINRGDEKDKKIEELTAKKLLLMKEVMIEEAKQSNVDLTEDDIRKIEEKIDQTSQPKSSSQDDGGKTNNSKGNGGQDSNSSKAKSSSDKSNNGNKGGNDKSKK